MIHKAAVLGLLASSIFQDTNLPFAREGGPRRAPLTRSPKATAGQQKKAAAKKARRKNR